MSNSFGHLRIVPKNIVELEVRGAASSTDVSPCTITVFPVASSESDFETVAVTLPAATTPCLSTESVSCDTSQRVSVDVPDEFTELMKSLPIAVAAGLIPKY